MDVNPYQPPVDESAPEIGPDSHYLATRGSRFAAAFIDGIASLLVGLPIQWALGMFDNFGQEPDLQQIVMSSALGFVIWFAIQIAFLSSGQTLGKKMMGIRMVDHQTGERVPVGRLVLLRYLPTSIVASIPIVGGLIVLVDILFIFGSEQRCIHDLIAGTKVVQA